MKQVFAGVLIGFVISNIVYDKIEVKMKRSILFAEKVVEAYKAKMKQGEIEL